MHSSKEEESCMTAKSARLKRAGLLSAIGIALTGAALMAGAPVAAQELKHYESNTPGFWKNPPPDWFLGDETKEQKGLSPPNGPPTGMSHAEIEAALKNIKLPPGFKISIYADGVNGARQMAWGDKGTLFVGSWFGIGSVYAITDKGGKKDVKVIIKGLTVPTGIAFRDGALYVADINKIMKYENAEANLDKMPARWCTTTCLRTCRTAGSILRSTRWDGCMSPSGHRATSACRPPACRRFGALTRKPGWPRLSRWACATA
jgi:hypothetical protein